MKLGLQLKLQLENVEEVVAEGEDFRWYIKVKCCNCGEESKWVYVTEQETVPIKGGRGNTNLHIKCKICGRENSLDIMKDSVKPYTSEDSGKFKTVVMFECRGVEVVDFDPRDGFTAYGVDKKSAFTDFSLTEKEWYDYDGNTEQPVSITELEFKLVKV